MIKSLSGSLKKAINYTFSQATKQPIFKVAQSALTRLKYIMSQKKDQTLVGVRISLSKKGCSGLAYNMDYIKQEQIKKYDEVVQKQDFKIVIDSKAIMAVIGTQMVFVEGQIGNQFVFNNPNQKGKCGCGQSFTL